MTSDKKELSESTPGACHTDFGSAKIYQLERKFNIVFGAIAFCIAAGTIKFFYTHFQTLYIENSSFLLWIVPTSAIVAIPILARTIDTLSAVRKLQLNEAGFRIENSFGTREYRWSDFYLSANQTKPGTLILRTRVGSKKIEFPESLDHFQQLQKAVMEHVEPEPTESKEIGNKG